jgi:hypothetical protein
MSRVRGAGGERALTGFSSLTASSSTTIESTSASSATSAATASTITSSVSASDYNVSSVTASVSTDTRTASSNFTLPSATATATWPTNFTIQTSVPYVLTEIDTANLPDFTWDLLNETAASRAIICSQQTKFCSTAGCADAGATINENFCNADTMGTRCTCDKGSSNLQQWKWPVQMSDCLNRGSACSTACQQPGVSTAERTACKEACSSQLSSTCGFPGQYSANYAVDKVNQKPNLAMIQGGSAGDGAMTLKAITGALAIVIACAMSFVVL